MSDRIPVVDLSYGCLDVTPVMRDWSAGSEDGETLWSYWEAFDYEPMDGWTLVAKDGSVVAAFGPKGKRFDLDDDVDPDPDDLPVEIYQLRNVEPSEWGSEGPMMTYSYSLGGDDTDRIGGWNHTSDAIGAAYRLRDVPLCVVEIDDKAHLALTGGGMDLSWEIVEAFTLLGYLPPVHFELPGMAGVGGSERDRYLIAAVDRSLDSMVERLQQRLSRHREQFGSG